MGGWGWGARIPRGQAPSDRQARAAASHPCIHDHPCHERLCVHRFTYTRAWQGPNGRFENARMASMARHDGCTNALWERAGGSVTL